MPIQDCLYFAPDIRFSEVDFRSADLPRQFRARLQGFYLRPAYDCAEIGHAFAAGALVLACADALARFQTGDEPVGRRLRAFARTSLPSFAAADLADRLYEDFRNGLIHEGRIKSGAQFSLEIAETVLTVDRIMVVNPVRLADEVCGALDRYIDVLHHDDEVRRRLSDALVHDHDSDIAL